MTVKELIEELEQYEPDCEVRLMTQQSWPFQNSIRGLCESAQFVDSEEGLPSDELIVYIVEGRQIGYGNKEAWDIC